MMENNEGHFYTALLIYMIIFAVVNIVIRLWYFIKCRGVEDCKNRKCKFNAFCFKYHEGITEEEAAELIKYLKEH